MNKTFSFLLISALSGFSLLTYLLNYFPSAFYNQPPSDQGWVNPDYARQYVHPWPNSLVVLIFLTISYFSLVFAIGYYRRSKGEVWNFFKKSSGTNILIFGLLLLGLIFFWTNWPTDGAGTLEWSFLLLGSSALISFLLILHEPGTTLQELQKQIPLYKQLMNISLGIAVITLILSVIMAMAILSSKPEGLEGLALLYPMFAFAVGVPVPLIFYFYFSNRSKESTVQAANLSQLPEGKRQQSLPPHIGSLLLWVVLILGIILILWMAIEMIHGHLALGPGV